MKGLFRSLVFALCFGTGPVYAQPAPADSLRAQWADTASPVRMRMFALARLLEGDSALTVAKAVAWAVPSVQDTADPRYVRQLGLVHLSQGLVEARAGRKGQALARFREALPYVQRAGVPMEIGLVESGIAKMCDALGRNDESVVYELRALDHFEAARDTTGMMDMLNQLAFAFSEQNDQKRSIELYQRNLALVRGTPDRELDMVLRIAERYRAQERPELARQWLDSAQVLMDVKGAVDREGLIHWLRGELLLDEGRCAEALTAMRTCATIILAQADNPAGKSWIRSRLAMAHLCAKELDAAIAIATEGLAIAEENGLLKEQVDNLHPLATAYEAKGDIHAAMPLLKRYHLLADSISNGEAAAHLSDAYLTAGFEKQQFADSLLNVQQRASAATALQKERDRRNLLVLAAAVAVVFGAISYRQRRRTQKALRRSDELLLNILPGEVAEELKDKGHAEAKQFDSVTILFSDFKGFTAVSEQLTPQELVAELNTCFMAFDAIVTARGIEKIKTIGDAYMCAGGLPDPRTAAPADVVHAALEMQAFMISRRTEREAQGKPSFAMRVGIHTGPVVAGIVGAKKFAYDIWGDTVNTASRMESSGEVGQVNISEATYALVKDAIIAEAGVASTHRVDLDNDEVTVQRKRPAFIFTPRGKVQAKGKGEMEMYFVTNA